jgi:hypothetical protein
MSAPQFISAVPPAPQLPAGSSLGFAALPYCSTSLLLRQIATKPANFSVSSSFQCPHNTLRQRLSNFHFLSPRRLVSATPGDSA